MNQPPSEPVATHTPQPSRGLAIRLRDRVLAISRWIKKNKWITAASIVVGGITWFVNSGQTIHSGLQWARCGTTPLTTEKLQTLAESGTREDLAKAVGRCSNVLLDTRLPGEMTLLHAAVRSGNESAAKYLLGIGAPPNTTAQVDNTPGATPLHVAAKAKQPSLIKLLLENKANPTLRDSAGRDAVSWAIDADDPTSLRLLLSVMEQSRSIDAQVEAARKGRVNILTALDSVGADERDSGGRLPLNEALRARQPEAVQYLLRKKPSLNAKDASGTTPWSLASEARDAMDEYRGELTANAFDAAARNNVDALSRAAALGADLAYISNDHTIFHVAAANRSAAALEWLAQQHLDPDLLDKADRSDFRPLDWALANNACAGNSTKAETIRTVRALMDAGANPAETVPGGTTPLELVPPECPEVMSELLRRDDWLHDAKYGKYRSEYLLRAFFTYVTRWEYQERTARIMLDRQPWLRCAKTPGGTSAKDWIERASLSEAAKSSARPLFLDC